MAPAEREDGRQVACSRTMRPRHSAGHAPRRSNSIIWCPA